MPAPESDQPVGSRRGRSPSGQWMLVSVEWPPGNDCEHNGGCDRGAEIPRGSCVDSACASLQWDRAASEVSTVGCWPRWAAATSASWPAVRTSPQCETGSMQRMLFGECTGGRSRQTGALPAADWRAAAISKASVARSGHCGPSPHRNSSSATDHRGGS
jgi:hypothetical protein